MSSGLSHASKAETTPLVVRDPLLRLLHLGSPPPTIDSHPLLFIDRTDGAKQCRDGVMPRHKRSAADIGRVGEFWLDYARQDQKTIMARAYCTSPWHVFPPIYLDETGSAYTLLLNPSGGLVGGDRLSMDMTLGPQSRVLISTPSANRVYRSLSKHSPAVQTIRIEIGPEAVLEWMPEHTIPFAGARFRQAIHVRLAPGATILLWDAVAAGRIASGERWNFASLRNDIRIRTTSGASLQERFQVEPDLGGVGMVMGYNYVASFFVVSDGIDPAKWAPLRDILAEILDSTGDEVLGGVTEPPVPGLAVKLVARSAQSLTTVQHSLWDAIRRDLLQLPAPHLRRY